MFVKFNDRFFFPKYYRHIEKKQNFEWLFILHKHVKG